MNNPEVIPLPLGIVKAFLIKGDRPLLVDTGFPGTAKRILDLLAKHQINPKDVSLIIITHSHSDHYGSIRYLKEATGAKVVVHKLDADGLSGGLNKDLIPTSARGRFLKFFMDREPKSNGIEPDILVDGEFSLKGYGVNGKIIATPGHTAGSISIILEGGEAIIGDLVMGGFIFRQIPSFPHFAYDLFLVRESLGLIMQLKLKTLHTSHGGPFTPEMITRRLGGK